MQFVVTGLAGKLELGAYVNVYDQPHTGDILSRDSFVAR
jgi:hypothetical protein